MGALLAPGKRTVTSCLRITGRAMVPTFGSYHQVLNRARWNPRRLARRLTLLLVGQLLAERDPVIIGLDDTIERRWGPRISARAIYRDPVRSSRGHFVKTSGLRWLSFMLLTPLPWLPGIKALPILTLPVGGMGRQARPTAQAAHRAGAPGHADDPPLPGRDVVFVGDSSFGTHELAHAVGQHATLVSRLRLDASLFAPPEPRTPRQLGRPRLKGKPLAKLQTKLDDPDANWTPIMLPVWCGDKKEKELEILTGTALWHRTGRPKTIRWVLVRDPLGQREPQAFFSTDTGMEAERILAIYVRRWQIEVTFQEVRAHLGIETQRQWSDLAIERTTPALLGLYSLICLWAGEILAKTAGPFKAAWYEKSVFTFSDAIAAVPTQIRLNCIFQRSPPDRERRKIQPIGNPNRLVCGLADEKDLLMAPPKRLKSMIETLCYAA